MFDWITVLNLMLVVNGLAGLAIMWRVRRRYEGGVLPWRFFGLLGGMAMFGWVLMLMVRGG